MIVWSKFPLKIWGVFIDNHTFFCVKLKHLPISEFAISFACIIHSMRRVYLWYPIKEWNQNESRFNIRKLKLLGHFKAVHGIVFDWWRTTRFFCMPFQMCSHFCATFNAISYVHNKIVDKLSLIQHFLLNGRRWQRFRLVAIKFLQQNAALPTLEKQMVVHQFESFFFLSFASRLYCVCWCRQQSIWIYIFWCRNTERTTCEIVC